MNHKTLGLLIILPVLLQTMNFTVIYSGYLFNNNYISANLCENRTVPEKHCEGKCQLNKALKAEEEKENSAPLSVKKGSEVVYLCQEFITTPLLLTITDLAYTAYPESYFLTIYSSIFHPPRA